MPTCHLTCIPASSSGWRQSRPSTRTAGWPPSYYFFVPIGRFEAGPYEICKSDVRFPGAPKVGDRVVLIVPKTRNSGEHYLNISYDGSVTLLRGDDVLLPYS